jgi:hypothetical protein
MIGTLISWVIAVIFAFWINAGGVPREGESRGSWAGSFQFVGARLVSWALIEEGIAVLISGWASATRSTPDRDGAGHGFQLRGQQVLDFQPKPPPGRGRKDTEQE